MNAMSNENMRIQYLGNTPSSDVPILSLIISSTIVNTIFYKILPSKINPLLKSYIISTIHAFVSVISVMNYFFKYEINLTQVNRILGGGVYGSGDEIMVYSVCYSCGYLIYDLILMLIDKTVRSSSALLHHITILLPFLNGLYSRVCHPCHFYLLAEELSTIPLNCKIFYRRSPRLYQFFSLAFVICFFFIRLIYGSIICAYAFQSLPQFLRLASNQNDSLSFYSGISQATLCISTRLLNFYWAILILKKVFSGK